MLATFLHDVAYFYRFYVFYTKYHPLLCLAEAPRLGRLFSKLEAYTSITSLACHIAISKKGTYQEKR